MRSANKITAALLVLFIGAVSFTAIMNGGGNGFPKLTRADIMDGGAAKKLESATAERFSGDTLWASAGAVVEASMGESIVNGIYITDSRLISAETAPKAIDKSAAEAVNGFARMYDGAVYFAAIPTSAGIYGGLLPSYLTGTTEKQRSDLFYSELSSDIRKIDAYNILKMLSDNYIYYRSDRKWTSYGAYCVYRTVIQKLGFMPVSYDKYTVHHITDEYCGDLYETARYMECRPDILDMYEYDDGTEITACTGYDSSGITYRRSLYDPDKAAGAHKYDMYLGERLPLVKISTSVNNDRHLLVIGDEFASCFIPFLTKHYSEIAFISADLLDRDMSGMIDINDYEQALFLPNIEALSGNIFEYIK